MAGMILVNNPGDWGSIYTPLEHAEWNGLTPTDLIFPSFVFIMGVSMSFSFSKYGGRFTSQFCKKLFSRTIVLFLLGMLLSWFAIFLRGVINGQPFGSQIVFAFQNVRILGVLQRLALAYFFGSLLVVFVKKSRWLVAISAILLLLYAVILFFGNGYVLCENNVIAIIDNALLGSNHVYREWLPDGGRIFFDPEGLLSTIPCISHVLLGYFCGEIIRRKAPLNDRLLSLSIVGVALLFVGFLLSFGCPINKKVWSLTYVLVTCGVGYLFLVLLTWMIDIRGWKSWSLPFQVFGTNPLFLYLFASFLAVVLEIVPIGDVSIKDWMYSGLASAISVPKLSSVIYALLYVVFNGAIGYVLFKKRIFIKL